MHVSHKCALNRILYNAGVFNSVVVWSLKCDADIKERFMVMFFYFLIVQSYKLFNLETIVLIKIL